MGIYIHASMRRRPCRYITEMKNKDKLRLRGRKFDRYIDR